MQPSSPLRTPSLIIHMIHGESLDFLQLITDKELPLTPEGRAHVRDTSRTLSERFGEFDVILHSTYLRSEQTALTIASQYPKPKRNVQKNALLDDRDKGFLYGLEEEHKVRRFPSLKKQWEADGELYKKFPGGGALYDVVQNMEKLLRALPPGRRIFLSGHWGTHWALRYIVERMSPGELMRTMLKESANPCDVLVIERNVGELTRVYDDAAIAR